MKLISYLIVLFLMANFVYHTILSIIAIPFGLPSVFKKNDGIMNATIYLAMQVRGVAPKNRETFEDNGNPMYIYVVTLLFWCTMFFLIYFEGLWISFCYFSYKSYCKIPDESATWLCLIAAFLAANYPLRVIASIKKTHPNVYFFLIIIPILFFISMSFYPSISLYLYEWALEPIINFIF